MRSIGDCRRSAALSAIGLDTLVFTPINLADRTRSRSSRALRLALLFLFTRCGRAGCARVSVGVCTSLICKSRCMTILPLRCGRHQLDRGVAPLPRPESAHPLLRRLRVVLRRVRRFDRVLEPFAARADGAHRNLALADLHRAARLLHERVEPAAGRDTPRADEDAPFDDDGPHTDEAVWATARADAEDHALRHLGRHALVESLAHSPAPVARACCRSAAAPRRPPIPIDSTAVEGTSISAPFSFNPSYSMFIARRCSAVGCASYDAEASLKSLAISTSASPRMMRACFSRPAWASRDIASCSVSGMMTSRISTDCTLTPHGLQRLSMRS